MWIAVTLREDEREALGRLADAERRDPRDQAALIIRQELERRGLLAEVPQQATQGEPDGRES